MTTVSIDLLSPLCHAGFGPSVGNAQLVRRMPLLVDGEVRHIPAVSGNALRGVMRRTVMRHLLIDHAKMGPHCKSWDALYASLANGGHLDGAAASPDPSYVRQLRADLPPLSLFGAALRSWMLAGRMRVGIAWLQCRETKAIGLVSAGDLPAEELVSEVSQVRHVDREDQNPDVSGVTPMPTTMEAIVAGATIEARIHCDAATDIERAIIPWALNRIESLGGKSSSGLGSVKVVHDGADPAPYDDWLASTDTRSILENLASTLVSIPKAAKKEKARASSPVAS